MSSQGRVHGNELEFGPCTIIRVFFFCTIIRVVKYIKRYSWVSRDVTSFAQVSVRHVGVPRVSNYANNRPFLQ